MQNNKGFTTTSIVIVVLLGIAIAAGSYYLGAEKSAVPKYSESPFDKLSQNGQNQTVETSNQQQAQLYRNPDLGFSFNPLAFEGVKTWNNYPLIGEGEKGLSMRGYLSFQDPVFYFAGMTPDYSAGRGTDCGEAKSYPTEAEMTNAKGVRYIYKYNTTDEMQGPQHVAYFKLKKGPFPVLGFCGIGISENDFISVINTVTLD
ncbi:MAG TPA: hypothetical protein VFQ59_00375 [Candidatus Paceibacterota bacterium]|nr:hypothetical protein [Candidatus Paceibacterota bacterium]